MQYAFSFDSSRCAQCFACELACKSVHSLRPDVHEQPTSKGPRYRQVVTLLDENNEARPIQYVSLACMHCGEPDCMTACPTKAIYRDTEFGVILVDQSRCIGCRYCSWACEFGAPQFDRDGLMQKCDMCIDRLREGKKPACVESCCGGALEVGPIDELEYQTRKKVAGKLVSKGKGSQNAVFTAYA